ncbi:hypothetical protein VNO77_09791 [Canavalia gladiata]|uniref:Secreted protein n=1 Tax=Canavalia gladiata TaxID=3824 RepID=A0AAN9MB43_CANGL
MFVFQQGWLDFLFLLLLKDSNFVTQKKLKVLQLDDCERRQHVGASIQIPLSCACHEKKEWAHGEGDVVQISTSWASTHPNGREGSTTAV